MSNIHIRIEGDTPFGETHLWQWLESQKDLPGNSVEVLVEYLTQAEYQGLVVCRQYILIVLNHFFWLKHHGAAA